MEPSPILVAQKDLCGVVLEEAELELSLSVFSDNRRLHRKIPHFRLLFLCSGSFEIMEKTRSDEKVDLISELPEVMRFSSFQKN
ncbi:hypothetical protein QYF36_022419 [Acer negundo]|nr:hypothetical protein QYF36_022419 [Acer negundo]